MGEAAGKRWKAGERIKVELWEPLLLQPGARQLFYLHCEQRALGVSTAASLVVGAAGGAPVTVSEDGALQLLSGFMAVAPEPFAVFDVAAPAQFAGQLQYQC